MKKKKPMKKATYRGIRQMNNKSKNRGAKGCLIIGIILLVIAIEMMTRMRGAEAPGAVARNAEIGFYAGISFFRWLRIADCKFCFVGSE